MVHGQQVGRAGDGSGSVEGYAAARELIEAAQQEAERTLADAQRRARSRELEADLLVNKARRLLEAAEAKAAVITAAARAEAAGAVIDLTGSDDLRRVIAPDATRLARGSITARIDRIVASAVSQAVDEAIVTPAAS
jgi:hypothetical protein